eukprot:Hpha_TRINITY_DN15783_c3_g7::TRINITY_DN15783_c3_g7_i2::g.38248::m.38248
MMDVVTQAIFILLPFAHSTRIMEQRGSNLITVHKEFKVWKAHTERLSTISDYTEAAEQLTGILKKRKEQHFDVDIYKVYQVLRVDEDQRLLPSDERAANMKLTLLYLCRYCERRGYPFDKQEAQEWLVQHFQTETEERGVDFFAYWRSRTADMLPLATFCLTLGRCVMDEGEVERNLGSEARVFGAKRTHLGCAQRTAEMQILLNYATYFNKEEHANREAKRQRRHELAKDKANRLYAVIQEEATAAEARVMPAAREVGGAAAEVGGAAAEVGGAAA